MQKNNSKKVRFNGFHGIDVRKSKNGETSIYDINNFRISDNGALERRCGYKHIASNIQNIRDIWCGMLNGKFTCMYLAYDCVYSYDVQTGISDFVLLTNTSEGPTQFFLYKDVLFMSDTKGIYRITRTQSAYPTGYVPLYGKDWPTTFYGEVNEPLNLLNSYARISYLVPEDFTSRLPTKLSVQNVISVYKNGSLVNSEDYYYDDNNKAISVANLKAGDRLTATVRFKTKFSESKLFNMPYVSTFSAANNSRLLFWSPNESVVFPSAYVSPASLKESEAQFPDCTDLYFPEGSEFSVGGGSCNVRGMARHYDRLLIFTEKEAWMANTDLSETKDFPLMNINTSVGCASQFGVVTWKNSPFTVGKKDILQWTSDTDKLDECNAFSISLPINERISPDFFKNAMLFKDEYRNELWFNNPEVSGDVWIYNINKKAWVRFSEIYANKFFDFNGDIGFIYGKHIYVFTKDDYIDRTEATEKPVEATLTTGRLNFDSSESKKLSAFSLDTKVQYSQSVSLTFLTDQNEEISTSIAASSPRRLKLKRLHSGRFFFLEKVVLDATQAPGNHLIHSLEIYVR